MSGRHSFLEYPTPIPFVHRGGPTGAPENTLLAFERAYAMGFRYFETDVHATADGVLVAFHDRSLRRLAGDRTAIAGMTATEVAKVRIAGEPVPLLADLLANFPDVRFNIDPKSDAAVRPLVLQLHRTDVLDRVCVGSFSDQRLRWLRTALGRRLCTGAGPRDIARARWAVQRRRALPHRAYDVLQLPRGLTPRLALVDAAMVEAAHAAEVPVHVWTVNDTSEMSRLLDLGVDGLMSDDAVGLRQTFVDHGIWSSDAGD